MQRDPFAKRHFSGPKSCYMLSERKQKFAPNVSLQNGMIRIFIRKQLDICQKPLFLCLSLRGFYTYFEF